MASNTEERIALKITVVGAGIAGLSAAVSLGRLGHSILVLESTKELQSVGAGLGLTPPTKEWFVSENVSTSDFMQMEGFDVRSWETGDEVSRTAFPPAKKMISVLHGDLQRALVTRAEELNNIELKFGSRVTDISTETSEVTISSGEVFKSDLTILADGVNSKLKWKVCPSDSERAQFTGNAAYRLVLPRTLLEHDGDLWGLVQTAWVKRFDGPQVHVVAYPVRNYELLNVVLIHPDEDAVESWISTTEKAHVIESLKDCSPMLLKLLDLAPPQVPNFKIFTHSPSPAWVKGNIMLLGDACHAMPPYLSQGVAQAVDDVTAISTVLSIITSKDQLPAALQAYESSRKARVIEIQVATAQAQQLAYRKDEQSKVGEPKTKGENGEEKKTETVVNMMRSTWVWNAAEAAEAALNEILKSK